MPQAHRKPIDQEVLELVGGFAAIMVFGLMLVLMQQ
jgi:hypothetical protein